MKEGRGGAQGPVPYLVGLNPAQREAVEHFQGPLLVLAGAGSGKTRVLTVRIGHLIRHHGVAPHRILAVTFTNKAAQEMRERVRNLLGEEPRGMWLGTFHALGARMLRRHAPLLGWPPTFTIYDEEQSLRVMKRAQEEAGVDSKRWNPKLLRAQVSAAKNRLVSVQEFVETHGESLDLLARITARVYPLYQEALRSRHAFDFDDLLVKPVELLRQFPEVLAEYRERFSFLLVDEYQDTNHAQFRFLELLAGPEANLMVVGDDDQSIYGWRGADIRNILDFEQSFPSARIVRLEENYRSSPVILEAANRIIRANVMRKGKTLRTSRSGGRPVVLVTAADEGDEALWIAREIGTRMEEDEGLEYGSFAVLYRTNAQARALEDAFRHQGIPYQVVGGVAFYARREIQDVLAYLRLLSNPRDLEAFERVVSYPPRGVGPKALEALRGWIRQTDSSLLEAAAQASRIPGMPPAGARGLEVFAQLIRRYQVRSLEVGVGVLLEELVEELGLLDLLAEEGPEGEERAENVRELIAAALDFEVEGEEDPLGSSEGSRDLDLFLQRTALVADVDLHDPRADLVTLMTLHNAKGLEFPVVFIAGLEEGLFPLSRAYEDPASLEEERRLFYVGITRARDQLYLSYARRRRRGGDILAGVRSSFLDPLDGMLEERRTPRVQAVAPWGRRDREGFGERRPMAPSGGRRVEDEVWGSSEDPMEDDHDRPRLIKGERVVHPTFGAGVVVEWSGLGPDLKITVDFDEGGRKKLLARYADLRRED